MRDELEPTTGKWYHDVEVDQTFRVVAIDEEREIVEIRYLDGEADEIELDAWGDLDLEVAAPPEDEDRDEDEPALREGERVEKDWEEDEDDDDWDDDEDEDEDEDDDQYGSDS